MADVTGAQSDPLDVQERAELERLRERVAELEGRTPRGRGFWRRFGVVVLIVLTALLALLSVTTRFVRAEILDTDHYVATVAPLASDPAVQTQVTASITAAIDDRLDIEQVVTEALQTLTEVTPADRPRVDQALVGLAPVIAGQAKSFVHNTVAEFVGSQQFKDLWSAANRQAHEAVVATVTGDTRHGAIKIDDNGTISIQLGPVIDQIKTRLGERGFGFADRIPSIDKQFVIFRSPELARAQGLVNALDKVATILPWLAILAAIGAVALAGHGRRLRTTTVVGVAVVVAMLLLALGILTGRFVYLNEMPPDVLSADAARSIFDTIVAPLRTALRAVAVLGLVIAAVGFFAGGSRSASFVRSGVGRGFGAVDARRADRPPKDFERWGWQVRVPVRVAIIVLAALLLMFWSYPTAMVVVWTVVVAALLLVVFEFVIQPARRARKTDADEDSGSGAQIPDDRPTPDAEAGSTATVSTEDAEA
ncbi:hypothetical protein AAFP35_18655 [Gordonia sp. CPCC 206044]|uniref:hypothetical protein n=1 Tax=Gordonia sp. CPCC 206044 TaxID=3140793 RepID=UPI003AF3C64E